MTINTLQEKFLSFLSGIHLAEQRLLEVQEQTLEQASDEVLRSALQAHNEESGQQIETLQKIFGMLGAEPLVVPSQAVDGLIAEGQEFLRLSQGNPGVLDCVIADIQGKVEHFEIACYRELVLGAQALGHQSVVGLLQQNLRQEEGAASVIETIAARLLEKARSNVQPNDGGTEAAAQLVAERAAAPLDHTATGENLNETTVRAQNEEETEGGGF
jgi:ferritin-like metal-binding protein YciE